MAEYTYVVYRYNANTANQPMTDVMIVGTFTSPKRILTRRRRDWVAAFLDQRPDVTVYANQFLSLIAASRASKTDLANAQEEDALAEREAQPRE